MDNIYFKYQNKLNPQKGFLLISEPYLPDPNFQRTVVLLCDHNDDGTFGFILNKSAKIQLKELIDIDIDFNPEVFIGGPVQRDTLHFLHKSKEFNDGVEIKKDLYWGGDFEHLITMAQTNQIRIEDFRFFIGYSGWGIEQLDQEINENSWIVTRGLHGDTLLNTDAEYLWEEILKSMGGKYEMFSKYPLDPRLN